MTRIKPIVMTVLDLSFYFTLILIIFLSIRNFVVQPFQVEGQSMDPTLHQGDQMLLNRLSDPQRFDIVIFPDPMGSGDFYVKRLIGLPGDQVQVLNDQLFINGQAYDEPYLPVSATQDPTSDFTEDFTLRQITGQDQVPEGYYFVLGDNRPGSGDSRQFGFVPIASILGTASIIYYPFDQAEILPDYILDENMATIYPN